MIGESTSSLTISWTPPFSLDVTGVDPDIWYSVFIYNVTEENKPTAILCTNITEIHYIFTSDYITHCDVYSVTVTPFNGAGQGESSPNVTRCADAHFTLLPLLPLQYTQSLLVNLSKVKFLLSQFYTHNLIIHFTL